MIVGARMSGVNGKVVGGTLPVCFNRSFETRVEAEIPDDRNFICAPDGPQRNEVLTVTVTGACFSLLTLPRQQRSLPCNGFSLPRVSCRIASQNTSSCSPLPSWP